MFWNSCERSLIDKTFSYDEWSLGARCIFRDEVVDQAQKVSQGDWSEEVEEIAKCLKHNGCCLRDDADVSDLEISLGIPKNDFESIVTTIRDDQDRRYHLAQLWLNRVDSYIKNTKVAAACSGGSLESGNAEKRKVNCQYASEKPTCQKVATEINAAHQRGRQAVWNPRAFNIQSNIDLSALKNYMAPRPGFQKTAKFDEMRMTLVECKSTIVHVYGMSGAGKSQIARGICKDIDENFPGYLIQHVQCLTEGKVIVKRWQRFVEELQRLGFVSDEERSRTARDLEDCVVQSFLQMLKKLEFSTLLVVEDVGKRENEQQDGEKDDEKTLIRNMVNGLCHGDVTNVQLVIVTQKRDSLFLDGDLAEMQAYECVKVTGFQEKEAEQFLKIQNREEAMITDLAETLAYMPLRLFLAKSYCIKEGISYEAYYNGLGKDKEVIEREKATLKEHPELGQHGYDVIMKLLRPKKDANVEEQGQFEVIKMMSFLDNSFIPDVLLGAFFKGIREIKNVDDERKQVGYLLRQLESECDLSVRMPDVGPHVYGKQTATIHNDILSAVRFSMDASEQRTIIIKVLQAVITRVGKENRFQDDHTLVFDMLNQMKRVAAFASDLLEAGFDLSNPDESNIEIQLCLSRLYDVLGFATTQHATSRDEYFAKAVDYLWSVACFYTGQPILSLCFGKQTKMTDKLQAVLHYKVDKDPMKTAEMAYERLRKASLKIPIESVMKNCERYFPITADLLKDMKMKRTERQIDWDGMEKALNEKKRLSNRQLGNLRQNGMLLTPKKLQEVFLTECIASILHSRGRQVLYLKEEIPIEEQRRYEWYTEVGIELCKMMSKHTGIKTIFEYILQANNKLPRLLHARRGENNHDFLQRLVKAREVAANMRDVAGDFYEHGVYKLVSGTPFTVMNAIRYLVKANTKLYKRPDVAQRRSVPTATAECEQLLHIAKDNAREVVLASSCMIHAGKYYAAIKEYEKALEAFENGFKYQGHGIAPRLQKNPNTFSWALYNCGRALYESAGNVYNATEHKRRFNERYDVLPISMQWREKLDEMKQKVNSFSFDKSFE